MQAVEESVKENKVEEAMVADTVQEGVREELVRLLTINNIVTNT